MSTTRLVAAALVAPAVALAAPTGALALTGTLNQPCYSHVPTQGSEPVVVSLAGGTPNANFLVAATVPGKGTGSAGSTTGTFDAAGNAVAQIADVSPPSGTIGPTKGQPIDISVQDFGAGGAQQALGQATVTNLALSVSSRPDSPRAHRRVSVSGTPFAGQRIYGFIVKGTSRHVLRRFLVGTGNACGFATARRVVAPRGYRTGTYRLYVNAGPRLDKAHAIWSSFRIFRRF